MASHLQHCCDRTLKASRVKAEDTFTTIHPYRILHQVFEVQAVAGPGGIPEFHLYLKKERFASSLAFRANATSIVPGEVVVAPSGASDARCTRERGRFAEASLWTLR